MSAVATPVLVGKGAPELSLGPEELREIVKEALAEISSGERVLAIIPDKTRDDNTHILFPFAAEILADRRVARFDALIAQGTHVPMTVSEKRAKIGLDHDSSHLFSCEIFDHRWDRSDELVTIGELPAARVRELTGGLID